MVNREGYPPDEFLTMQNQFKEYIAFLTTRNSEMGKELGILDHFESLKTLSVVSDDFVTHFLKNPTVLEYWSRSINSSKHNIINRLN